MVILPFPRRLAHSSICLLAVLASCALASRSEASPSITLAWDPIPEPDVAGYRVYYGTQSGYYPNAFDAGTETSATLSNLEPETTYYCVVTGYNQEGYEGLPSDELVFLTVSAFQAWQETYFTQAELNDPSLESELWGSLSDPDGDQITNFLEYAFGRDPRNPDITALAQSTLELDGAEIYPAITFQRPLSVQDVRYTIQLSDDFVIWRDGSVYEGASATPVTIETTEILRTDNGTIQTITVRANQSVIDPTLFSCFLRVQALEL